MSLPDWAKLFGMPKKKSKSVVSGIFQASGRGGPERLYNKPFAERGLPGVVMWEVLDIADCEIIRVVFEGSNSPWRQGIWLHTDRGIKIDDEFFPSVVLWKDSSPPIVECTCLTGDGKLSLYNVWDCLDGRGRQSQNWLSGMLVEETANGRRYHCTDMGLQTNFEKLIFRVEITSQSRST